MYLYSTCTCTKLEFALYIGRYLQVCFYHVHEHGVGGRVGKSDKSGVSHGKGEGHVVHAGVNCVCNVCGSAHSCGCVVNGSFARAAF